tara:strand:- start:249 stop:605 length:357 start_codon:yes stop_codon:yes gene_type:complete
MKNSIVILLCVLFSSCATILTGSKQDIYFESSPKGAKVLVNGFEQCKTPCTVPLKKKLVTGNVQIVMDGYESTTVSLSKSFNPISILNLLGIIGWAVDAGTGAIKEFDNSAHKVTLEK